MRAIIAWRAYLAMMSVELYAQYRAEFNNMKSGNRFRIATPGSSL